MNSRFLRGLLALETEEQILNAGALLAIVSVFFPWVSGEWLGGTSITYSGFGFYTSFIGYAIFIIQIFVLMITLIPLVGGPILIKRRYREWTRLAATVQATVLLLAALSVLTKVTFEFSRMEVRFGIYLCLIGSLVSLFFSASRVYGQRKSQSTELFRHPEDEFPHDERKETTAPLPPPPLPPPPPEPEDHPLYP